MSCFGFSHPKGNTSSSRRLEFHKGVKVDGPIILELRAGVFVAVAPIKQNMLVYVWWYRSREWVMRRVISACSR